MLISVAQITSSLRTKLRNEIVLLALKRRDHHVIMWVAMSMLTEVRRTCREVKLTLGGLRAI